MLTSYEKPNKLVNLTTSALPGGTYRVRVFLYDWQTNERLALADADNTDHTIIIDQFTLP